MYHKGFHFVSVGKDNNTVWFHDRQVGRNRIYEKMLEKFSSSNLQSCDGHTVSSVIHKNKLNWTRNCHAPAIIGPLQQVGETGWEFISALIT
jgi:hypothetical protein